MTVQNPIPVDLFTFVTQGNFDCIRPGQTKDWILSNFPDPDSQNHMGHNMSIWLYGTIEFHFEGEILFLIHCDNFDHFGAGDSVSLNKWLLAKDEVATLADVLGELHKHKVCYTVQYGKERNAIIQVTESKVKLYFDLNDEIDHIAAGTEDFVLEAFSLLHPDYEQQQR